MYQYLASGVPSDPKLKRIFEGLIKTLKQRSLALEQYDNLGFAYAVVDDNAIDLFSKFIRKAITDPE